jgi:hypothetical protein
MDWVSFFTITAERSLVKGKDASKISECNRSNYHLLRRSFGQCVAIAQVIDLNVLNIIPVGNVYFGVEFRIPASGSS